MNPDNDPRVFFSAERTLLAWIRTGLTVIGLGFVVARFGLFLRMLAHQEHVPEPSASATLLGVAFVLLGSVGIAMGLLQFVHFTRSLPASDRPQHYHLGWSVGFAGLLAFTGLVLAVYLMLRSGGA